MAGFRVDEEDLPPGFRFRPKDDELVRNYLEKKVHNQPLPNLGIRHINVYDDSPMKLAESYEELAENHWYFFSTRDRKYPNGNRPQRRAGNGTWKATGSSQSLFVNGINMAEKRTLVYYMDDPENPNNKKKKSDWLMQEFTLNDSSHAKVDEADMRLNDVVLCKIYINSRCCANEPVRRGSNDNSTRLLSRSVSSFAYNNGYHAFTGGEPSSSTTAAGGQYYGELQPQPAVNVFLQFDPSAYGDDWSQFVPQARTINNCIAVPDGGQLVGAELSNYNNTLLPDPTVPSSSNSAPAVFEPPLDVYTGGGEDDWSPSTMFASPPSPLFTPDFDHSYGGGGLPFN